jgi:hypothetical protein
MIASSPSRDGGNPGGEVPNVLKFFKALIQLQKHLLHDVGSGVLIAAHPQRDGIDQPFISRNKFFPRLLIAINTALHQLQIHRSSRWLRTNLESHYLWSW